MNRVVLAYAGDPETTAAIRRLRDTHQADVITVTVDFGQAGDLSSIRSRALAAGAARAHVIDAREEFAAEYLLRAVRADACGDAGTPLTGFLARALIVAKTVDVAAIEHAAAVAHGCTGEGSQRFAVLAAGLDAELTVFAAAGRSQPRGSRASEAVASPERPATYPDAAACVEIRFERGVPAAVNGVEMPLLELCSSLATIGGAYGIGRTARRSGGGPLVPAGVLLHRAHAELQRLATARETQRSWRAAVAEYRDTIVLGRWFTTRRGVLDAYVDGVQERVTGAIGLELFKGGSVTVGRSLFGRASSQDDEEDREEQAAAGSFDSPRAGDGVRFR